MAKVRTDTEDDDLRNMRDVSTTSIAVGVLIAFLIFTAFYIVNFTMGIVGARASASWPQLHGLHVASIVGIFVAPVGTICGSMAKHNSNVLKNLSIKK